MSALLPVLLAEDSVLDAELVLTALSEARLANQVIHVRDGSEALDYLFRRGPFAGRANEPAALVLLDLRMPKVDGLEVLRVMKTDPALGAVPVVIMTSSREEQDMVDSCQHGAHAYLVKPLQIGELMSAVTKAGASWALLSESQHDPRSPV